MYIPFNELPSHARIWVYQSNRPFSESENSQISSFLPQAIHEWNAHGAGLKGSFEIRYNQVVIIGLDESANAASGCSIDASTKWLKELGAELHIDFFDRTLAVVDGDKLDMYALPIIKKAVLEGQITPDSKVITPLIPHMEFYRNNWPELAAESWVKRYFVQQVSAS
ncbi:hypothetical protein V7S76_10480 [Aquirufa sp. ROCK2-A2]